MWWNIRAVKVDIFKGRLTFDVRSRLRCECVSEGGIFS